MRFNAAKQDNMSKVEEMAYCLVYCRLLPSYPQDKISIPLQDLLSVEEMELICTDRLGFARAVDRFAEQVKRKAYFEETVMNTTESIYWMKVGLPLE